MLPDINGFEVIRRLKTIRETRRVPVVLLTSLARTVTVLRGAGGWPVEFLNKPVDAQKLLELVDVVRGTREAIGHLKELGRAARASSVASAIDGPLTRRILHRQLAGELENVKQAGVPAAWLRLEVDLLQGARSRLDRPARRTLFHQVAEIVRASTRTEDLVACEDDDAFTVLLAGVTPLGAQLVGQKIQEGVAKVGVPIHGLTVSLVTRIEIIHWAPCPAGSDAESTVTRLTLAPRRARERTA